MNRNEIILNTEEGANIAALNFLNNLDVESDPIGARFHVEQISSAFLVRCFEMSQQLDRKISQILRSIKMQNKTNLKVTAGNILEGGEVVLLPDGRLYLVSEEDSLVALETGQIRDMDDFDTDSLIRSRIVTHLVTISKVTE